MVEFEVGDAVFWVSVGGKKPFPVNVFRKNGTWTYDIHCPNLSPEEKEDVAGFCQARIHDMYELWKPHMKPRLEWKREGSPMTHEMAS